MNLYIKFLKNNKIIRDLSFVNFITSFGAWFSMVAIYTLIVKLGASELSISIVTAMHFLPAVLIAPLSGAFIDRVKIKPLMIFLLFIELFMTILFLTINKLDHLWILLILIFIRMCAATIYFSSQMSLLPKLLNGKELQTANEINAIIWSFTYAVSMAISGFIINLYGIKIAIIIDACIFALGIFVFIQIKFQIEQKKVTDKIFRLMKDGYLYIKNNKIILHLIFLHSSVGIASYDALITILAKNQYKEVIAVPLAIGLSNAIRAISLMIGPMFLNKIINNKNLQYLFIFEGIAIFIWASTQNNFYLSLFSLFLVGFGTAFLWSYTYTLLQNKCDNKYIGRVISYNDMVFMLSNIITTMFIGVMAHITNTQVITMCLGIAFILFGFYYTRISKLL